MRLLAIGVVLCLALKVPCADARAQSPIEIDFWTTEVEPNRVATIEFLMHPFAAEHGVRISVRAIPEEDLLDAARAAAANGDMASVVQADSDTMMTLLREGLIDPAGAASMINWIGKGSFANGAIRAMSDGEALAAVPFQAWIGGIWYREDWFRAAGLNPPDTPANALHAAQYFHTPLSRRYGIGLGKQPSHYTFQTFAHFWTPRHCPPACVEADLADAMRDYAELAKHAPPSGTSSDMRELFLNDRLAMLVYSSFLFADIALGPAGKPQPSPDLVTNARFLPTAAAKDFRPFGVVEGLAFGRSGGTAEREAAKALVSYLFEPNVYMTWLHMAPGGMLPVRPQIARAEEFYNDWSGVYRRFGPDSIRSLIERVEHIRENPLDSLPTEVSRAERARVLSGAIAQLVAGNQTAEAAARWALSELAKPL
jgi:multiple sugar transport system substrate-binding protein